MRSSAIRASSRAGSPTSGYLEATFLAGYGGDPLGGLPPAIESSYRLDTVMMLALVFLAEAPDPAAARAMIARAHALLTALQAALQG